MMDITEIVLRKRKLFGTTFTLRSNLRVFRQFCWLASNTNHGNDLDADSIILKCLGLGHRLLATRWTNPRIGGPQCPMGFDDVRVTGTLASSPFREFDAMLADITEVTVFGCQGREIAIDLIDIDKPHERESQFEIDLRMREAAQWNTAKPKRKVKRRPTDQPRQSIIGRLDHDEMVDDFNNGGLDSG